MTDSTLRERMDRATAARRLLDHPFYRAWADGTLTREDLRFYATQYWRQVESFPRFLEVLSTRVGHPEVKAVVSENLSDELDGDHAGLWLRFAEALGAARAEVLSSEREPETDDCTNSFGRAAAEASPAFALGMLYGYESQTPEVAATKVKGLRENYDVQGPGLEYFELHGELDVEHSNDLARAIALCCNDDISRAEAVAGAEAGAAAIYGLLDGVARVRNLN